MKGTVELGDLVVREEGVHVEEGPEREGGAPGQTDQEEEQEVESPGPSSVAEVGPPPEGVSAGVGRDVISLHQVDWAVSRGRVAVETQGLSWAAVNHGGNTLRLPLVVLSHHPVLRVPDVSFESELMSRSLCVGFQFFLEDWLLIFQE